MRDDLKAISDLCERLGGLSATGRVLTGVARELLPDGKVKPITAQHVYNWGARGRVAPDQRLIFLTAFNRVMPKSRHLDLMWLASPAANYGNGSAKNGRTSRRKAAARRKAWRQAQDKRGRAGARA